MTENLPKKKILVLGGGFGGVRAAIDLSQKLPHCAITLINKTPFHCFSPNLYEVSTALLQHEGRVDFEQLQGTVSIPLKAIFAGKNIDVVVDTIKRVDLTSKKVFTSKQEIEYDYLVLSLGSKTSFFGIPGAQEYSHPLKDTEDALNIRNDLEERLRTTNSLRVVIAGGGFTGVELAAEMGLFLSKRSAKITIVEALDSILTGMPAWSQEQALSRLKKLKVEVRTGCTITKVDPNRIYCEGGQEVGCDYLIWTTGILGESLNGQIQGVGCTRRGQLEVNQFLQVKKFPEVFVIGDLAQVMDPVKNAPLPPAAWVALSEAKLAAENVASSVLNKCLKTYKPPYPAFIVPIGGKFALTNIFGVEMTGPLVWALKQATELKYLFSILPWFTSFKLWWRGISVFTRNDLITKKIVLDENASGF